MKRLILITFLLLGLMSQMEMYAGPSQPSVTVPVQKSSGKVDRDDDERRDKRIPSAPLHCIIDFVNHTVSGLNDTVIIYEVCDTEDGEVTASFSSEYDFVEFLSSYNGDIIISLSSDRYTYIGYLSL